MKLRRILAAALLAALLFPALTVARIGTWKYLAPKYSRPLPPRSTLGPIPPDSMYCIADTITNAAAINPVQNPGGTAFTAESTLAITTAPWEQIFLAIKVLPTPGDTSNMVRIAVLVKALLSDTSTTNSDSTTFVYQRAIATTDSMAPGQDFGPAQTGATVGVTYGERIINIDPWRGRGFKYNNYYAPEGASIFAVFARGNIGEWHYPPPFIQVRLRCIGFNNADATKKPFVYAWLIGVN